MEELYIKPGNQERGWNDPPQFSYGLQTAQGGPKRNLLNKRVPPPQLQGPQSPVPGGAPPPIHSTPPLNPLAPPPCAAATPLPPCSAPKQHADSPSAQSECEPDLDDINVVLNWALTACRQSVKKQVCDDVERRLKILEEVWRAGKLSLPVRRRMSLLAEEMKSRKWARADEIHRALIVDYVNEVSQWMVGIKRLIAETRQLSADTLDQNQNQEALHGAEAGPE
ncbi:steroid receptor RNA activator 1 [Conger conger]|uniref:steroid receptor RNA activator 1 n=1 Tax=Conger conger TaxID=82655 RepID=UPI002A59D405|nr:steroid receptor RNA activator 1 [Conger conger]